MRHLRRIALFLVAAASATAPPRAQAQALDAKLQPGDVFRGRVAFPADVDRVTFPALAGTRLTVRARAVPGSKVRPRVALLQDGAPLPFGGAQEKVGKEGRLHRLRKVKVPASATCEIVVHGQGKGLGDYDLVVQEVLPDVLLEQVALGAGAVQDVPFAARSGAAVRIVVRRKTKQGAPVLAPRLFGPGGEIPLDGLVEVLQDGREVAVGPVVVGLDGSYAVRVQGNGPGTQELRVRIELEHAPKSGGLVAEAPGHVAVSGSIALGEGEWLPDDQAGEFAANELLVRLAPAADAVAVAAALGGQLAARAPDGWVRVTLAGDAPQRSARTPAARRRVQDICRAGRAMPGVLAIEPNRLRASFALPNDPYFPQQWDLPLCRFPEAWEIQAGSTARAVAVLDTGIRAEHPDLGGRLLPGFDFVGEAWNAGDGNGIDHDPTDAFISMGTHGTHVTGTIAAATANGVGVAGGAPLVQVMPVRVLGVLGGTDFDIAQGIRYAAGLPNVSGKLPAVPVAVINLSLGGPTESAILHDAVQAAVAAGVLVVAAAGNANSAVPMYPAAFPEVLAVAATDRTDQRAYYSSYGSHVDLAAPGGDKKVDTDGDGHLDGILSTVIDPGAGAVYALKAGTSMAAPHVAAAAHLLRSAKPLLPPVLVEAYLAAGAVDRGPPGPDDDVGWGRLDVARALDLAMQTIPGAPVPFVVPRVLGFGFASDVLEVGVVSGAGNQPLHVTSVTSSAFWLTPVVMAGTAPCIIEARVQRAGLAPGGYQANLRVETTAGVRDVPVQMAVAAAGPVAVKSVHVLAYDIVAGQFAAWQTVTEATADAFMLDPLPEGTYRVFATTDLDHDGVAGEEHDYAGAAVDPETGAPKLYLSDGTTLSGAAIVLTAESADMLPGGGSIVLDMP